MKKKICLIEEEFRKNLRKDCEKYFKSRFSDTWTQARNFFIEPKKGEYELY